MRFVMFCHSVASCWNNGNAHFQRGIVRELKALGHEVLVYEPADGWSRANLTADFTSIALEGFKGAFPGIRPILYDPARLDLDGALDGADVVLVHEWNEPPLVAELGRRRKEGGRFLLLFHDTHHRALTVPSAIQQFELDGYDGVLAFGETIREIYLQRGWAQRVWTWHEAADTAHFYPRPPRGSGEHLIWIGNWGDDERAAELRTFLLEPVRRLGLSARIHGVRYPDHALAALEEAGIEYRGWLANHRVPELFASYRMTVHVPRRPYVEALPGIPTIRVFEALACGIPLVCAPWDDSEGLFRPGTDYLVAKTGDEMTRLLRTVLKEPDIARELARNGLETIRSRHTCRHRVLELLSICRELGVGHEGVTGTEAAGWK